MFHRTSVQPDLFVQNRRYPNTTFYSKDNQVDSRPVIVTMARSDKRKHDEEKEVVDPDEQPSQEDQQDNQGKDDDDDDIVGPQPVEKKLRKQDPFERLYLDNLPSSEAYERSFMHRDVVTHVVVTPTTDFIITGSCDGHVKFWKKMQQGIEFVKHFRAHLGSIQDMRSNSTGSLISTICASDQTLKVFDVINFDMINMIKLPFTPKVSEWVHSPGDALSTIAVSDSSSPLIRVYDGKSPASEDVIHEFTSLHSSPVTLIRYNCPVSIAISVDSSGFLEYWSNGKNDWKTYPLSSSEGSSRSKVISFDSKLDTDLFEFVKEKVVVHDLTFSPDCKLFATISSDRKIRIFKFATGKVIRVWDESLVNLTSIQKEKHLLPNIEFSRKLAIEAELDKNEEALSLQRIAFDKSGTFLLYPIMIGVKVVNWSNNKCVRLLAKGENLRPLSLSLYQDIPNSRGKAIMTPEMQASDNPNLVVAAPDPTLFATAFKKNRFFLFSRRNPESSHDNAASGDRDVFNEKPSREDMLAATETVTQERTYEYCCLHTSMGDIHCKLFVKETPKTVENFCVHAKNGYYNNHIFHRIIRQFMIQTGDPTGTGTGGQSIWGAEFEDEIHPNLKHDKPFMLSMANAGPNTNGSQFFITVVPCPWLDKKHTIFGHVVQGMEVVQNISNVKTNPKTDKPYDEVKIISISLKQM